MSNHLRTDAGYRYPGSRRIAARLHASPIIMAIMAGVVAISIVALIVAIAIICLLLIWATRH